ncbi:MAG TPA: single-stranded DNA-binding protein [Anaerolineales bacterium]|nr:single-stranded DNA-binding protein [Anaerolineales bacterium]
MANDLNRCEFIGRLGKPPETRYMPNGKAVTSFSLAVGSQWKNKAGEKQEATEWVNCTAFDKLGEICGEYLKKGSQVYVSGKLKTDKYDKDGVTHYSTKVIVNEMQMLGGKSEQKEQTADAGNNAKDYGNNGFDNFNDDIVF